LDVGQLWLNLQIEIRYAAKSQIAKELERITPVTGSSDGGIADRVAWSSAADEERPSAHTLPRPR